MHIFQYFSLIWIKPKGNGLVKFCGWQVLLAHLIVIILTTSLENLGYSMPIDSADSLPNIEAQAFNIEVISRSNSSYTYLFSDPASKQPKVGRILLVRKQNTPVMVVRVLKLYPDEKLFAAKRIKTYGSVEYLQEKDLLVAVEKIMDSLPPPVTLTDEADLQELEDESNISREGPPAPITAPNSNSAPSAPPTGTSTTPSPLGESKITPSHLPDSDSSDPEEEDIDSEQDKASLVINEIRTLDQFQHWLTTGFGLFKSYNPSRQISYLTSGNVRYGLTLAKRFFINRPNTQDSIVVEGSFYFFKAINFASLGDAYSVVGISPTLRYNVNIGQKFGVFIFGGLIRNFITAANNPQSSAVQILSASSLAGGVGMFLQLGPSWYTRLDVGIEAFSANLVLRF